MSEIKKNESGDDSQETSSSSKKTIRFVQEKLQDELNPSNLSKSDTSRAASESTTNEDLENDDIIQENQNKFRSIKTIDTLAHLGEERINENASPSKRMEKSNAVSSVQSENYDDNLSVHFGGMEVFDVNEEDISKFEYEPDDIPAKSILKNDLNRSKNQSFDVRNLKDIEGKIISHEDLSEDEDISSKRSNNTILKDSGDGEESYEDNEDDYLDEEENNKDYRQRIDSEVRFKLIPQIQEGQVQLSANQNAIGQMQVSGKRNSQLFPSYSILKNSPLVQPSEFKALKNIDKVSHYGEEKNEASQEEDENTEEAKKETKSGEESDVRFVGDIVLQEKNAYKFKYNPQENPKKPIIKRSSCNQGSTFSSTPTHAQLLKKKRMSYDFQSLKNVDGKMLKHLQQKYLEDSELEILQDGEKQERDIKFGGIQILDQTKLGDPLLASKIILPQKPILKQHVRSSSCDFKKSIKNIDGVYIRKRDQDSSEEDTKVVHFGERTQQPSTQQSSLKEEKQKQIHFSQKGSSCEQIKLPNKQEVKKSSIFNRSSSFQIVSPPSMLVSCDESPTSVKKKSIFSARKIELKEAPRLEVPTEETFTANWTSIRNDYIESATKFISRIDPKSLHKTFADGMDTILFAQIVDMLSQRSTSQILHGKPPKGEEF